jgi:hypothetical protein
MGFLVDMTNNMQTYYSAKLTLDPELTTHRTTHLQKDYLYVSLF